MTEEGTAESAWDAEQVDYNDMPDCKDKSPQTQVSTPGQGSDEENQMPLEQSSATSGARGTSR
jgi:hypothetical protein